MEWVKKGWKLGKIDWMKRIWKFVKNDENGWEGTKVEWGEK
jgi:hypothetical protein